MHDVKVNIREMSGLEMYGAVAMLTNLLQVWHEEMGCESSMSFEDVDSDTYYCGKILYINGGYTLYDDEGPITLTSVFCVEGNQCDLFGYAEVEDEDGEIKDFLVRIQ